MIHKNVGSPKLHNFRWGVAHHCKRSDTLDNDTICKRTWENKSLEWVHSLKLTWHLKMMVSNRNLRDSRGLFSGATLVSGSVHLSIDFGKSIPEIPTSIHVLSPFPVSSFAVNKSILVRVFRVFPGRCPDRNFQPRRRKFQRNSYQKSKQRYCSLDWHGFLGEQKMSPKHWKMNVFVLKKREHVRRKLYRFPTVSFQGIYMLVFNEVI